MLISTWEQNMLSLTLGPKQELCQGTARWWVPAPAQAARRRASLMFPDTQGEKKLLSFLSGKNRSNTPSWKELFILYVLCERASPSRGSIPARQVPASSTERVVTANVATLTSIFNETSVAKQKSLLWRRTLVQMAPSTTRRARPNSCVPDSNQAMRLR